MRKVVWKFKYDGAIEMPKGAKILTAEFQGTTLMLWALVDPAKKPETRMFELYATGQTFEAEDKRYVTTVYQATLVWHLFEIGA